MGLYVFPSRKCTRKNSQGRRTDWREEEWRREGDVWDTGSLDWRGFEITGISTSVENTHIISHDYKTSFNIQQQYWIHWYINLKQKIYKNKRNTHTKNRFFFFFCKREVDTVFQAVWSYQQTFSLSETVTCQQQRWAFMRAPSG